MRGDVAVLTHNIVEPSGGFIQALRAVKKPFIVAHVTPDADAIGAILGLAAALRANGIEATVGLETATIAEKLKFMLALAPDAPIVPRWDPDGPYDAAIILDTAGAKRINISPAINLDGPLPIFNIDHHVTNPGFGLHNWVDAQATSSCELVGRLLEHLGFTPSAAVASLLYAGVHGDTAGFSLPTTSAEGLRVAGWLVECGADVGYVGEQMCRSMRQAEFDLLRIVYDNTGTAADGRIAYSHLSYEEITGSGCQADDIDDQVNVPRSLKGVQIAMLFTEGEKGVIRVNLRGEGDITIIDVAKALGGGGHAQSAGIRFYDKTMDESIEAVVDACAAHLAQLDAAK